ncbi:MAG: cytochrome c [Phenylobacterium sp.]|uniref:c-type cytochrome n=1 Tax=Phenylobacterium sp. TaxID=1871053 RepID=UPI002733BB45|nr:cytochrome c [Phenylobacterium sp.]MDP1642016.1 cytochrome c [Phenylobacterium sp.]MDP3117809.1 cytochrome c [Phenylobacterium sp.]MDP3383511.1 cytochrome c [Phenylobacterium sp.]
MTVQSSSVSWRSARRALVGASLALLVAACGQQASEEVAASDAPVPAAVAERQEGFKALGASFKLINDQLKTDAPDMAQIVPAAERMNVLASQIPGWFPAGTGPDDGVKTDALATVWTDPDGFAAAQTRLATATTRLQELAIAGDAAGLREHVKMVGASCGGCHDNFRVEQ